VPCVLSSAAEAGVSAPLCQADVPLSSVVDLTTHSSTAELLLPTLIITLDLNDKPSNTY